ncbi:hypothetical protein B9Z19DRAFT_1076146 [Tuber borchii]|uniref:Uncharacterized protein n=1 Tax=Tuber borchii TaxID=42251 RepID=A0A2T7A2C1_TUBBO|nr:hypothetical protein B9Z19DRAFT_1076146 [Tuber borchii]
MASFFILLSFFCPSSFYFFSYCTILKLLLPYYGSFFFSFLPFSIFSCTLALISPGANHGSRS